MPKTPAAQPDIWPLLRAAGFCQRTVPAREGARPQPAMRLFYAVPDHLVVVLEYVVQRPTREVEITELAVYPDLTDLTAATGGRGRTPDTSGSRSSRARHRP